MGHQTQRGAQVVEAAAQGQEGPLPEVGRRAGPGLDQGSEDLAGGGPHLLRGVGGPDLGVVQAAQRLAHLVGQDGEHDQGGDQVVVGAQRPDLHQAREADRVVAQEEGQDLQAAGLEVASPRRELGRDPGPGLPEALDPGHGVEQRQGVHEDLQGVQVGGREVLGPEGEEAGVEVRPSGQPQEGLHRGPGVVHVHPAQPRQSGRQGMGGVLEEGGEPGLQAPRIPRRVAGGLRAHGAGARAGGRWARHRIGGRHRCVPPRGPRPPRRRSRGAGWRRKPPPRRQHALRAAGVASR